MFHQELVSDAEYVMTKVRVLQDTLLCYTTGKVPPAGAVLRAAAERARSPKRTEKGNDAPHQSYTLARHCGSCILATVKFLVTSNVVTSISSHGWRHRLVRLEDSQS